MALYNKMRPSTLNEVRGQEKIVHIMKDNLASNRLPNAILLVGTRGVGKTTIARIIARTVNCSNPLPDGSCCNQCDNCKSILAGNNLDVIELDAASNNGVDNIRDIIEQTNYKPIANRKVIILDEVHMLSTSAFNALLKVLEEPPKKVLFILCTTELQKVPATILSRCRKFHLETISDDVIAGKLKDIARIYKKNVSGEAIMLVVKAAKGSMRDAESIFETFLDTEGDITEEFVRSTLGLSSDETVFAILDAIKEGNPILASSAIEEVAERGGSLEYLLEECFRTLMDVLSINLGGDISGVNQNYVDKITDYAYAFSTQRLYDIADAFRRTYEMRSSNLVFGFQAMLIGLACSQSTITELTQRVEDLEKNVLALVQSQVSYVWRANASEEELPPMEDSYIENTEDVQADLVVENGTSDNSDAEFDYYLAMAEQEALNQAADEVYIAESDIRSDAESACNSTEPTVLEGTIKFGESDPIVESTSTQQTTNESSSSYSDFKELEKMGFTVSMQDCSFEEETIDSDSFGKAGELASSTSFTASDEKEKMDKVIVSKESEGNQAENAAEAPSFGDLARQFIDFSGFSGF